MLTQISGPNQHFSAYYEDNSLLIQFIVVEFVHAHQLIFQTKSLMQEHLDSSQVSLTVLHSLRQLLGQLLGCFPQHEHSSFSRWTKGSLTKLKEYSEQFSRNSFHQNKQHVNLHMATHQAWLTAIHYLELINSLCRNPYTQHPEAILCLLPVKRTFNTLQIRFNQVIRSIPRVISDYGDNENVILCLLRKKAQFAEIYGPNFFYKHLKWPVKTKELVKLLTERYQSRGFEALLPTIQQFVDS